MGNIDKMSVKVLSLLLVFTSANPVEKVSLTSEVVKDVTSSSAPAYWNAECGGRTYVGSYTLMMDWTECRDYCQNFPHAGELGHSFTFADILDTDTMECLRYNMNQQYTPGNGYAGHYWAGGYRGGDGQYRWDSGEPFDFNDFIGNPGEDPYIHLTPGNNYQWNTKSDKDDTNNGCICKSLETLDKKQVKQSECDPGWSETTNRCLLFQDPMEYGFPDDYHGEGEYPFWSNSEEYCLEIGDGLSEWSSDEEFIQVMILAKEHHVTYHKDRPLVGISDAAEESVWRFLYSGNEWLEARDGWYDDNNKYWCCNQECPNCEQHEDFAYLRNQRGFNLLRQHNGLMIFWGPAGPPDTYTPLCQKLKQN